MKQLAILSGICIVAIILLLFRQCRQPKPIEDETYKNQTISLQKTIDSLSAIHHTDTLRFISEHYRLRIDTVRQWLQTNNSWDTICRSVGFQDTSLDCKDFLLTSVYRAERNEELISVYRRQRANDSNQITLYKAIDSIQIERISNLTDKYERLQQQSNKRQKIAYLVSGGLLLALILK